MARFTCYVIGTEAIVTGQCLTSARTDLADYKHQASVPGGLARN
jgi:hypothetical protein